MGEMGAWNASVAMDCGAPFDAMSNTVARRQLVPLDVASHPRTRNRVAVRNTVAALPSWSGPMPAKAASPRETSDAGASTVEARNVAATVPSVTPAG